MQFIGFEVFVEGLDEMNEVVEVVLQLSVVCEGVVVEDGECIDFVEYQMYVGGFGLVDDFGDVVFVVYLVEWVVGVCEEQGFDWCFGFVKYLIECFGVEVEVFVDGGVYGYDLDFVVGFEVCLEFGVVWSWNEYGVVGIVEVVKEYFEYVVGVGQDGDLFWCECMIEDVLF